MSYILTLVASKPQISNPISNAIETAMQILNTHNVTKITDPVYLSPKKALEITISSPQTPKLMQDLHHAFKPSRIDVFITSSENRRKKLLLADMDSTIVEGETLDDMAESIGLKTQIAAITAKAMNGEIDFHDAIRERVALLKNMPIAKVESTLKKVKLNPGAEIFVRTMASHGAHCALVSGGFTIFTAPIAAQSGFHTHHGNTLCIDEQTNTLTGKVGTPILDKHAKVKFLYHYLNKYNLTAHEALTIGDGANDIPMLQEAGLGLGYYPKEAVKHVIPNVILYGDLTSALYAQGYTDQDFVKS